MAARRDGHKTRVTASTIVFALLASILLSSLFQGTTMAHTGDYLLSPLATTEIVVDGNVTAVEWSEASAVDLGAMPGNTLDATLRVKHNDSFVFVAFDATGDTGMGEMDTSLIAFDTGHDAVGTVGREDQFFHGGLTPEGQAHLTFDGVFWTPHDAPYDESLPGHAGLASASGFGPSDLTTEDHRSFEFRVPLALLGVSPGEVLGFVVAIIDYDTQRISYWPQPIFSFELESFGDVILDTPAQPVDVRLLPPSGTKKVLPGETAAYRLDVINRGTAGDDTFDLTASSTWSVSFWDANGTSALPDANGNGIPDTGILSSGSNVSITAKVEVPVDASEGNQATVTATSDAAAVSGSALLIMDLQPARFNPPHFDFGNDTDVPADGLFNDLVVWANVTVAEAGVYQVQGILFPQDGTFPLSFASFSGSLTPGNETVDLLFSGQQIFASSLDGPYSVLFRLYDSNFTLVDQGNHTTRAYGYTEFQKPPAYFAPTHSDFGLDTDGDGLFDYLVVNTTVQVDEADTYRVNGVLDPTFPRPIRTSNVTSLDVGLQTVPLWFDGVGINASDVDGPYTTDLRLYNDTFAFMDNDTHLTAAYSHLEFQSPPAAFAPPHSDFGLDTDADGLFDHLVVDAEIEVKEGGTFSLQATLLGSHIASAFNTTTLVPGLQTVPLWFEGLAISSSGVDGPYTVNLALSESETFIFLDADTHTTEAYSHSDFEEPEPTFRLGTILPFTGILESFGHSMREAADLAAADINAAGGVLGIVLELLHRNSATDASAGRFAAEELVFGEEVPVVIGAAASVVSLPVAEVTIPNEVVQISPASTSALFTTFEPEEPGWFWRTTLSDALQAKVAALRAIEKGWTKVGILVMDNIFGPSVAESFRDHFSGEGRSIVQVNYTEGQPDYTSELQLLADTAPDGVFLAGFPADGLTILQNWEANRAQPGWDWNWLFWEGLKSTSFVLDLRDAGVDVSGAEGTAAIFDGPNDEAFRTAYSDRYGRAPEVFAAHTYDAVYLTALAAVAGQATDSLSIRDSLIRVVNPPGTVVGLGSQEFERAVGILEAGGEINYEGASGLVNFDEVGDVGSSIEIWRITQDHDIVQAEVIPEWEIWPPSTDTTPPDVGILSPSDGAFLADRDVVVNWMATDLQSGVDRIEVGLDGETPVVRSETETSHTFSGVADGPHVITVKAFDTAGNSDATAVDFTVDTVLPVITITSPSSGTHFTTGSVNVEWTATDQTAGIDHFEVSLNGGDPVMKPAGAADHILTVEDGPRTITVTAVDRAGNTANHSVDITVDTNILSFTGPLGATPLMALIAGIVVAVVVGLLLVRRWRRG